MEKEAIYHSPVICYEVSYSNGAYNLEVYIDGFKGSKSPKLYCRICNFSEDGKNIHNFAQAISQNAALPIHIPELAEEFLSA